MISSTKKHQRKPASVSKNLAIYWTFLRPYTFLFVLTLLAIFVVSVIHIVERYLFKEVIDGGTQFAEGSLLASVFVQLLIGIGIFYLVLLLTKALMNWFELYFLHKLESKIILDLKHHFFTHLVYLSHKFHTTHKSGSLIARLIRGGGAVERMTDVLTFNIAPLLFELIVVSYALFSVDKRTLIVIFFYSHYFYSLQLFYPILSTTTASNSEYA